MTSLPYLPEGALTTPHYAGHVAASEDDDKELFYWMFAPDVPNDFEGEETEIPLVVWLNGGPGCSSMDGLWIENGPLRLKRTTNNHTEDDGWTIRINSHSWHRAPAWLLYVDQPVGTGLSFTKKKKYCRNDREVNEDFYLFLTNFLLLHADTMLEPVSKNNRRRTKRPVYLTGESHAGHYIPSMADFILRKNDDPDVPMTIRVAGAAVGNGWVDPRRQYEAATAAYGAGLVDLSQFARLRESERACHASIDGGNLNARVCYKLLDDIVDDSHGGRGTKVSTYDTRVWEDLHKPRDYPPGHKDVESYLGRPSSGMKNKIVPNTRQPPMFANSDVVLESLHATGAAAAGQFFRECTDPPWEALRQQDGKGVVDELVRVLEHESEPRVLFFNGIHDLICNHVGNERLLDALSWRSRKEWAEESKRYAWDVLDETKESEKGPAGYVREHKNLIFLKILNAGHMVPLDRPGVALTMMRTFLYGGKDGKGFRHVPQNGLKSGKPPTESWGNEAQCEVVTKTNEESLTTTTTKTIKEGKNGEREQPRQQSTILRTTTTTTMVAVFVLVLVCWWKRGCGRRRLFAHRDYSYKRGLDGGDPTANDGVELNGGVGVGHARGYRDRAETDHDDDHDGGSSVGVRKSVI